MNSFITRTYKIEWAVGWAHRIPPDVKTFDTLDEALEEIEHRATHPKYPIAIQLSRMEIEQ